MDVLFFERGGRGGGSNLGVSRTHKIDQKESTDTRNDKNILVKPEDRFIFKDQRVKVENSTLYQQANKF